MRKRSNRAARPHLLAETFDALPRLLLLPTLLLGLPRHGPRLEPRLHEAPRRLPAARWLLR